MTHYILIDADFLDQLTFDFTVQGERMFNRQLSKADLGLWLDCIALDGGLRPGENAVTAVFLHEQGHEALRCFTPSSFKEDLDGKAFKDNLGEFTLLSYPVEEVVSKGYFFVQSFETLCAKEDVGRVMLVADMQTYGKELLAAIREQEDKRIILYPLEPMAGRGFEQEILTYSVLHALGINGE